MRPVDRRTLFEMNFNSGRPQSRPVWATRPARSRSAVEEPVPDASNPSPAKLSKSTGRDCSRCRYVAEDPTNRVFLIRRTMMSSAPHDQNSVASVAADVAGDAGEPHNCRA